MTPEILQSDVKAVQDLLRFMIASSGLQLSFTVTEHIEPLRLESLPDEPVAAVPLTLRNNRILVEFTGLDTPLLTARNGELLNAMEHVVAKSLRLEEQDHDRISFDADSFKADRDRELRRLADTAIESVRSTGKPYAFRPMTSHERRLLHLLLAESGLPTASSGETPRRFVVLHPAGYEPGSNLPSTGGPVVPAKNRVEAIRSSFRRR